MHQAAMAPRHTADLILMHDLSTDAFDAGAVTTGAGLFARLKERTCTGYRGAAGFNHHRATF
jgi:hypothetical protein